MLRYLIGSFLAFGLAIGTARADAIITIDNQVYTQGTGVQNLAVVASSTDGTSLLDLTLTFQLLPSGSFASPSPGSYGQSGMIGNGNYLGSSSFTGFLGNFAIFNGQYSTSQPLPASAQTLLTFAIDTSVFAPGAYTISTVSAVSGPTTSFTLNNGGFTISAVPEPSSLAMLGLAVCGVGFRRRTRA